MESKRFITAQDVVEELGVSVSYEYKLIRQLNAEREADRFVVIKRRVSRQYFDSRIYGTMDKKEEV
ncbi:MarR family transcriptional regulator [Erysipelatoclostridium sp. An15]|uniref:MarR family transcriptional regulator n=1 Tax=Erysipelatoclostridium sp. An15 TaxID=1965566 RepID=UPI000B3A4902|nr:MarR family transcriptional regulator [Erysipelatoclostridium sp. An15]OUQ07027.1 MarR family transcriptional regulator [Erysipelatoclostridium sp. An15]